MKTESIDSPDDPRLADYRGIRDREWLSRRGVFVAEGRRVVQQVLRRSCYRPDSVLLSPVSLDLLSEDLRRHPRLRVLVAPARLLESIHGLSFHQGCLALVGVPAPVSIDALLSSVPGSRARILVAEHVTDPDNIGALFRNARAFGVHALLLSPRCASPYYRKTIRTSQGSSLELPFCHASTWPDPLVLLGRAGFERIALTPDPSADELDRLGPELPLSDRLALCVGNEGEGLTRAVLARCDRRLQIPMAASADSINVATAAAIACAHVFVWDRVR